MSIVTSKQILSWDFFVCQTTISKVKKTNYSLNVDTGVETLQYVEYKQQLLVKMVLSLGFI